VLVHGLFGFDAIGPIDYWWGIPSALRNGGARVYVTQQSAANASEVRGEQLLAELRRLKAAYGHQKFNLIGHSHGGHTIRYVAGVAPDLVASVTSVGSPHAGSPVADNIAAALDGTGSTAVAASLLTRLPALSARSPAARNRKAPRLPCVRSPPRAAPTSAAASRPASPATACGQGQAVVNNVRYYSIGGTGVLTNAA
jgi:triacylglycerol lipase